MNNWNTYVRFSFDCIKANSNDQVQIDESRRMAVILFE